MSFELSSLVLPLCFFSVKNFAVIWWGRGSVAYAPFLARLFGSCRSSVPRSLHRFSVVVVQALGCPGLVRFDIHYLRPGVLGPDSRVRSPVLASSPWVVMVGGSCMSPRFEMWSVLFPINIRLHFFGISRSFLSNVLIPSLPQLLASS